jgi:hypothetical protein
MENKIYLVRYCGGNYEDYYSEVIFATTKKTTATKYVTKFNRILKKWKDYYSQFEHNDMGFNWIKEEYVEQHFQRWNCLRYITNCYYEEVNVR